MNYLVGKVDYSTKEFNDDESNPEVASLKDVPLEVRRREARKPLYLTRYE